MAKRVKQYPQDRGTVLFDVVFEDGSRASNRRVPMEILGGLDGDQPARDLIEQQEAEIALKAGPLNRSRKLPGSKRALQTIPMGRVSGVRDGRAAGLTCRQPL
jgi:hypothetical protein